MYTVKKNGEIYYLEEIRSGKKELAPKTMYIRVRGRVNDEKASPTQSSETPSPHRKHTKPDQDGQAKDDLKKSLLWLMKGVIGSEVALKPRMFTVKELALASGQLRKYNQELKIDGLKLTVEVTTGLINGNSEQIDQFYFHRIGLPGGEKPTERYSGHKEHHVGLTGTADLPGQSGDTIQKSKSQADFESMHPILQGVLRDVNMPTQRAPLHIRPKRISRSHIAMIRGKSRMVKQKMTRRWTPDAPRIPGKLPVVEHAIMVEQIPRGTVRI